MDDVPLGAVHMCAIDDHLHVAIIVAQKRNKKGHVSGRFCCYSFSSSVSSHHSKGQKGGGHVVLSRG